MISGDPFTENAIGIRIGGMNCESSRRFNAALITEYRRSVSRTKSDFHQIGRSLQANSISRFRLNYKLHAVFDKNAPILSIDDVNRAM
jgi:hypothetical protein